MYPVICKIGSLNIYSYGLMAAIGYAVATWIILKEAGKENLNKDALFDMLLFQIIVGVCGSRILYILEYMPEKLNLDGFFAFEQGGMTFYGSFITSFIFDFLYLKLRKIPFWHAMDCIAIGMPIGMAIARVGCFLNGCCYGIECSKIIGFQFRLASPGYHHATQLYESAAWLLIFFFLKYFKQHRKKYGEIFLCCFGIYGFLRFFIEFLRAENPVFMFGMTLSQTMGVILTLTSAFLLYYIRKSGKSHTAESDKSHVEL